MWVRFRRRSITDAESNSNEIIERLQLPPAGCLTLKSPTSWFLCCQSPPCLTNFLFTDWTHTITDKYRIPIPTPLPFIWIGSVMVKILAEGFALRLSAEALAKVAD